MRSASATSSAKGLSPDPRISPKRGCCAVRAAGTDPNTTFTTVVGNLSFDAVGDTNQKFISLFKVDMTAGDGTGDWVFMKQVDAGSK